MGKIKSAFEKAMEKVADIGTLTEEEKKYLKEQEEIKTILVDFFKGRIDRDTLWQKLKGRDVKLLKETQIQLIDSLGLGGSDEDFIKRKEGIIAIETLKKSKHLSQVEELLNTLEYLRKQFEDGKQRAIDQLKDAVEKNPQLRLRPMRTSDGRTVFQAAVSVDEAVQERLSEFLADHEERFNAEFNKITMKLKWLISK
jgi:hypothetical protein